MRPGTHSFGESGTSVRKNPEFSVESQIVAECNRKFPENRFENFGSPFDVVLFSGNLEIPELPIPSGIPTVLVPIALFSSLSRRSLGTRIEGLCRHTIFQS